MSAFATNADPRMTRYLVDDVRAFAADPLTIFDIGARGGIDPEWAALFGDQVRIFCFEPDEEECRRLAAAATDQVKYIPSALGTHSAIATLYEAKLAASSSLYKTRMEYFARFLNHDNGITVGQRTVAVISLDEVVTVHGVKRVDFIKLDAEGAELDILRGGVATLAKDVLGILSEIRLHREINGSPPFADLDVFLRAQGFRLYDIKLNRHSRKALPYPGCADYRLPSGERFFAYTTRGQVQDGDALYFRDMVPSPSPAASPTSLLKLCALLEIYSLNDCAAELILANLVVLRPTVDPKRLLDLLASGIAGRALRYPDYLDSYFSDATEKASAVWSQPLSEKRGLLEQLLQTELDCSAGGIP